MPESTVILAFDDLRWRAFAIPGSTPDVRLSYLHVEPDKAFTAVVQFPAGWSRPGTGWYDHIEQVLFLDGEFQMSGRTYRAGDYGWFPAGYVRSGSSSAGALALAWFSGPNRWITEDSPVAAAAEHGVFRCSWRDLDGLPSPLGQGEARLLTRSRDRTAWIVDGVPAGRPAGTTVELFALEGQCWARVETGTQLPDLPGPALCRVYEYPAREASTN